MTPAAIHMRLTELQLLRRATCAVERSPAMWTEITPTDDSGRSFVVHVVFEYGPDTCLNFALDAAIAVDAETLDRLDHAIFTAAHTRWLQ